MSVQVVPVQLRRQENSQPWGFRLRGGSDQGIPLHVEHVSPKGRAVAQGLAPGDVIVAICGAQTQNMTHMQVKQEMLRAGNELDLMVAKGAFTPPTQQKPTQEPPQPHVISSQAPPPPHFTPNKPYQKPGSMAEVLAQGGALRGAPPQQQQQQSEEQRVQVVEEPVTKLGGPTYKNVQTKTMQVLESELPQSSQGGAAPASIFNRNKEDRSAYLHQHGSSIQKAYGQTQ